MAFLHKYFTSDAFKATMETLINTQVKQHLDNNKQEPSTPITTATSTTTGNSTFATQPSKPSFASVARTNHPTPPPGNIWTTTPAAATFPPLPSPTAPSTKRLHPKGPPTRNPPPPPGFTRPSPNTHPASDTPPLQTAISEFRTTTSSIIHAIIHVNREHYRTITSVHPNPASTIGDTLASSINQVLLHPYIPPLQQICQH